MQLIMSVNKLDGSTIPKEKKEKKLMDQTTLISSVKSLINLLIKHLNQTCQN